MDPKKRKATLVLELPYSTEPWEVMIDGDKLIACNSQHFPVRVSLLSKKLRFIQPVFVYDKRTELPEVKWRGMQASDSVNPLIDEIIFREDV